MAVEMLQKALELDPDHLEAGLALAPALARRGERVHALRILRRLEKQALGKLKRRVRWVTFRVDPSFGTFWHWLRA
ncbi:MAG: hypothetical protein QM767_29510 [Anaeromyxobacter sp.]